MLNRPLAIPALLTALVSVLPSTAMADETFTHDRVNTIVEQLQHFGFTHVTELEAESGDRATVEGWRDPTWRSELTWSTATGQGLEEELEYGIDKPWGVAPATLGELIDWMTRDRQLPRIESLEVESDGRIELEGEDHDGESVTLRDRLEAFRPLP